MRGGTSEPLPIPSVFRVETLARQTYTAIRASIRSGTIAPEGFYSEVQLAQALGISRTPVREALIELEREGLIEIIAQRGFRLRTIPESERREAFELRILIESNVVRRLAKDATEADINVLRGILDDQERVVSDSAAFLDADEEFHLTMPMLLQLERTRRILLTLRGIIWLAGHDAIRAPTRAAEVIAEHRAIVDRIAARDPAGAAKAVRAHVQLTRGSEDPDAPRVRPRRLSGALRGGARRAEPTGTTTATSMLYTTD
jgi:DNA-binding GntR family transcriptional regulator